jgi:hypothetical protein
VKRALKSLLRCYGLRNRCWIHRKDLDAMVKSGELVEIRPSDALTRFLEGKQ